MFKQSWITDSIIGHMHLTHVLIFLIEINPLKLIYPLIKEEKVFFSWNFMNKHFNSSFKDHYFLCLRGFLEK